MSRFYLRLIFIPIVLFTAILLIIHAQPYDDHELRQLLLPEGCPAPCFMGIRPGVTKMDEAVKILEASGWVSNISRGTAVFGGDTVDWSWNDQKLKFKKTSSLGELWATHNTEELVADVIGSYQSVRLGDVVMFLGDGDLQFMYVAYGYVSYYIYYGNLDLSLQVYFDCGVTEPYKSVVDLRIGKRFDLPGVEPIDALGDVFRAC